MQAVRSKTIWGADADRPREWSCVSRPTDFTRKGTNNMVSGKRLAAIAALAILMGSVTARAQNLGIGDLSTRILDD